MSVKISSQVWEWSNAEGSSRLVLLALADFCDDDGFCFPGIARVAKKCRINERTVQRCIKELEECGELVVDRQQGAKTAFGHTNRFRVTLRNRVTNSHPTDGGSVGNGVTAVSPKPSVEPSVKTEEAEVEKDKATKSFEREWNQLPQPFPKIRTLSEGRVRALRARLKGDAWRETWREALARLPDSPFLRGENDRKWVADVDWFLKPDSVAKVIEGKYNPKADAETAPAQWWRAHL